jgi:hypothetical protein
MFPVGTKEITLPELIRLVGNKMAKSNRMDMPSFQVSKPRRNHLAYFQGMFCATALLGGIWAWRRAKSTMIIIMSMILIEVGSGCGKSDNGAARIAAEFRQASLDSHGGETR